MFIGAKYKDKRGNTFTLSLSVTENVKGNWLNCIALFNSAGDWQLTEHWRTNHTTKAHKAILSLGYEFCNQEV